MKTMSTEIMEAIITFVDQYYCERHATPSVNEIAVGVQLPKTTAYRYLIEMNDRGMIEYDGRARTIRTAMIDKFAPDSAACSVVGSIPCGTAEDREAQISKYVSLPVSLFGKGDFYILEASGDSMVDAGIDDGDLVVIRTDVSARVGSIVVALTEEKENTLKVYAGVDRTTGEAILEYRNRDKYPGREIRARHLEIQGVASQVIKSL